MIDEIRRVIELPYEPMRVWQAITEPSQLSKWFGDRVEFDLTVGAHMRMEWDEFGSVSGAIEIVEPIERFAFRWRATGISDDEPMTALNSTLVCYTLMAIPAGSRLTVSETGFATLPDSLREAALRENNNGWDVELADLKQYFAELTL